MKLDLRDVDSSALSTGRSDKEVSLKSTFLLIFFLIFSMIFPMKGFAGSYLAPQPEKFEGDKPYTPTRLEWLTSYYQNECGLWLNGIPTVSWGLLNKFGSKDTLSVEVRYGDEKLKTEVDQAAETCERNIKLAVKDRGWNWIKTEVNVKSRFVVKTPAQIPAPAQTSNPATPVQAKNLSQTKAPSLPQSGFTLKTVEKGSLYEMLGLKQGDTIKSINGNPTNSMDDLMIIPNLLKTADKIDVDFIRNGTLQKATYKLK